MGKKNEFTQFLADQVWGMVNSGLIPELDAMKTVDMYNVLNASMEELAGNSSSFLLDDWESSEDYVEI